MKLFCLFFLLILLSCSPRITPQNARQVHGYVKATLVEVIPEGNKLRHVYRTEKGRLYSLLLFKKDEKQVGVCYLVNPRVMRPYPGS